MNKTVLVLVILLLNVFTINAQDNCGDIKKNIDSYKSLIKSYDRDAQWFTKEILKYSEQLNDKAIKEKHDLAKTFLAVVERDKLTAISNKERLENNLKKCYIGTYLLHTETLEIVVEIILKEDRLMYIEKRGGRTFEAELHPLSSTKFFFKENSAIVHFNNTINCETPSFDISIDGKTNKFIRM